MPAPGVKGELPDNSDYYKDGPSTYVADEYATPLDPKTGARSAFAPGVFPPEMACYFDYHLKGKTANESCYRVNPLLLQHLLNDDPSLQVLDCEGRNLTDFELYPVMRALKDNTVVTDINLSRNKMDLAGLELAEILKTNTTVKKLNLNNNDMHARSVTAMAEMISCNSSITELNLSCNFVRDEAAYIAESLLMNSTLRTLHLDNCQIADEAAKSLISALDKSSIKEFRGFNNTCIQKVNRQALRGWKPAKETGGGT